MLDSPFRNCERVSWERPIRFWGAARSTFAAETTSVLHHSSMERDEGTDVLVNLPKESLEAVFERQATEKKEFRKRVMRIKSSIPKKDKSARARAAEDASLEEKEILARHATEREELGADVNDISEELSNVSVEADVNYALTQTSQPENGKKKSKAARRRQKKAEQEAESQRRIEEEKSEMGPSAKFVETEAIVAQLKPKNLHIHAVAADGHCLYNALAHQMEETQLRSEVAASVEGLRSAAADYILANKDDFMPFIECVNGDQQLFEGYCEHLRKEAVWGGQVEVKALAELLDTCIEIYAAGMPVVVMKPTEGAETVLRLSFHRNYFSLGEHYNSVVAN